MCYTLTVVEIQQIWKPWVHNLHHWGMQDVVATFLEVSGPINVIGAQVIYLCQPFLKNLVSDQKIMAITGILEDPAQTHRFISSLREAEPR
ncbi:MAG: hypothetical protein JW908_04190 [Anaerolineales bacterium]|nr:hypothetical protein [Anaerolineales bacterium]